MLTVKRLASLPLHFIPLLLLCSAKSSVLDYAPAVNVECPDLSSTSLIRVFSPENQTLHPEEERYINTRESKVIADAWREWLGDGSRLGYNISLFEGKFPRIAGALPGGGLRAAQYAASCLNGLDARNDSAKVAGTGGLLQVMSYMSGLSGGSWALGSFAFNDWPTFPDLLFGNGQDLSGWLLDIPFVTPDGDNVFSDDNQAFFGSILSSVIAKSQAGIDTSITDPWSRMISYHFLNQTTRNNFFTNDTAHGAGQLWSNIPLSPSYQQYRAPFPIALADSRPVGSNITTALGPDPIVYEITPLEIASYDPNLSAGMNLSFAGTHLVNGRTENGSSCVRGFDQGGFVMGTSASLFNQIFDTGTNKIASISQSDSQGLLYVLSRQLQEVRTRDDEVANWPNPFAGLKNGTFEDSDKEWLELLDGSSNLENVPYGPLFVKARAIDVIVTIESSADDVNNWPNGSSLIFTASRQSTILQSSHQQFPPIPKSPQAFIDAGVNARPTFFGCNPVENPPEYPLVVYLPNSPPFNGDDPVTNTATFQLSYTLKHTALFMDQVLNNTVSGFTPNTNSADPNWGLCLQCAAIDRARLKMTEVVQRSALCSQCFKQYCYDPENPPSRLELPNRKQIFVDPDPEGLDKVSGFLHDNKTNLIGGLAGLVGLLCVAIFGLLWWKKRKGQRTQYKQVVDLHEGDTGHRKQSSYELHTPRNL